MLKKSSNRLFKLLLYKSSYMIVAQPAPALFMYLGDTIWIPAKAINNNIIFDRIIKSYTPQLAQTLNIYSFGSLSIVFFQRHYKL